MSTTATIRVPVGKIFGAESHREDDWLAIEDPLEIRTNAQSVAITMRTPGHDGELAAGFLLAEGLIQARDQILNITTTETGKSIVDLQLTTATPTKPAPQREFLMTSACGMCGKESLEDLQANRCPVLPAGLFTADASVILSLPGTLRQRQQVFDATGGLHAAALFTGQGELLAVREDVGRHNAVDKLVGQAFLKEELPWTDRILLVSGRASYELVQKALVAGAPILAAVGAPSSLAVETAARCNLTLIGFLRDGRFNIYTAPNRITTHSHSH